MRTYVFHGLPRSALLAVLAFAYLSLAAGQLAFAIPPAVSQGNCGFVMTCDVEGETWSDATCTCVAPPPPPVTENFYTKTYVKRLADYGLAPKKRVGSSL
jgi:hypothetical protein